MAKSLRSIFFDVAAAINSRGKRINFKTDGQPDEALMQNLVDSATFFKETDDRARQAAGGNVENEVGLVTIAPDSEAKAGTSGLTASRTKVSHAAQLPTSESVSQTMDTFTGSILDVTADAGTLTRNQYKFKWTATFVAFMNNKLLPDFVGGDATKIVRINAGGTAYELVDASTIGDGEVNDGAMTGSGSGTGLIFKTKTGLNLIFKKIKGGTFMTVSNGTDDITLDVDGAGLVSSLVDPIYSQNGISIGAGAAFFKQKTAGNIEIRSATQGANAGIVLVENANDVSFAINDAYINGLIDARGIGGIGGVLGISYLFHASTLTDQILFADNDKIIFADDSSTGNFDTGNTWTTNQWVADADAVTVGNVEFTCNFDLKITKSGGIGSTQKIDFELVFETAAGVPSIMESITIQENNESLDDIIFVAFAPIGIAISNVGDKVYIRATDTTGGSSEFATWIAQMKIIPGGRIFNLEA